MSERRKNRPSRRLAAAHRKYFGSMSDVEAKSVDWLWYPYVPYHAITLIAGEPSHGKSFLTMELAGIISNGKCWPFSKDRPTGKRVLILSAEDDAERAMAPRLDSIGADRSGIRYMKLYRKIDEELLGLLKYEIERFRPEVVIIDTVSAYMGADTDMNKQVDVQDFLVKLTAIAMEQSLSVIIVAHLNKKVGESATHRINGSIGFVAGVRSVIVVGTDPENTDRHAFCHAKSNWGPKGETLTFKLEGGGRDSVPKLVWQEVSSMTADDVCKAAKNPAHRPKTERTMGQQYIVTYLEKNGPSKWRNIVGAVVKGGPSSTTLVRARNELQKQGAIEQRTKGRGVLWGLVTSEGADE